MVERELKINKKKSFFIFGPRQVGKSTFIKANFPKENTLYYDFLLNEEYLKYLTDTSLLRKEISRRDKSKRYVVIDEVQRIPEILNEVHYLLESLSDPPVFVLSGSSARKLKRENANMLGGRALTYQMFPLSYRELGQCFDLDTALRFGSLPSIYLEKDDETKIDSLRSYTETYLEEEIKAECLVRNINGFVRFLKVAAEHNGDIINFSNISRETSNSRSSVKEFFQILEDTLVGFYLLPYSKSARKRLVSHPKFYFFDIGVTRAIRKQLNSPMQPKTYEYGKAFEQFLILELIKFSRYNKKDLEFSFYRTNAGAEVDLIIETPDCEIFAVEIKANTKPDLSELKGLRSFAELVPGAKLICASLATKRYEDKGILILPWQELFDCLI